MTYKGYSAKVTFDADAKVLNGEVIGLRDVITFQATSVEGLERAFRDSVDDYLAWCAELGQGPERPYADRTFVRMDPSLHRDLALAAERAGVSINAFVVACLERDVGAGREHGTERRARGDSGGRRRRSRAEERAVLIAAHRRHGQEDTMLRQNLHRLILATFVLALLATHAHARFEWQNVVQDVRILADGSVEVRDERTLWTDQDFGEAFLCVQLRDRERLSLIEGETTALSPGPPAVGLAQPCDGGTEVVVRQEERVSKRRVRFAYRIEGSLEVYADVVRWYWNILERDRPVVVGYELTVRAPGAMGEPFDAFVMRYGNPEVPSVELSDDRSLLRVTFDRVPVDDGVEIRYLMDPRLFDVKGDQPGLASLLREQARLAGQAVD